MFMGIDADPVGLPRNEFNKHLDALLTHNKLNPDIVPYMSIDQQRIINEVKKPS